MLLEFSFFLALHLGITFSYQVGSLHDQSKANFTAQNLHDSKNQDFYNMSDDMQQQRRRNRTLSLDRLNSKNLENDTIHDVSLTWSRENRNLTKAADGKVVGDKETFVDINEAEECADDDSSTEEEDEEAFLSGIKAINDLSKEGKNSPNKNETKKSNKKKEKKDKIKEFLTDIDLKDIQNLFEGKNITEFQVNMFSKIRKKEFKMLKEKLYNKKLKLRILDHFDSLDKQDETKLDELIQKTVKHEQESIRYKINFPLFYHAVGTITLPVDDLVEPFESWYAGELNMSRIDYYYGMDKSYQRGDIGENGVLVKITPAHWGKKSDLNKNTMSCWYKPDSKWSRRRAQTVVPLNIKKFKFAGEGRFNGNPAYKFSYQKRFVNKNNTYLLHVSKSKPHKPLRYEMIGYDHLLRSHYDHYIIDYLSFDEWEFDYRKFQIPKRFKCYKKLHNMNSHFEANPMWDFLHGEEPGHREHILNETYKNFKEKHKKVYKNETDNHKRKDIFRHNSRFVHSHNRANLNYSLELNHFSDVYDHEFELMQGQRNVDTQEMQNEINGIPQLRLEIPSSPLPKELDWRDYGLVSNVHSQSFCASCWAFSAIGAIEAGFAMKNGSLEEFSVQQLIDCSWSYQNNGCRGGWSWRAFKFVSEHGIATRKSYGKYLGQEGYCHCGKKDHCDAIKKISYRTIEKHDPEKLKVAVTLFGPGSIAVQSNRKTFKFYARGIYDDPKCGQKTEHAVVIIGYGKEKNTPYWIIKNSWGRLWGDKGYIKVAMKDDLCGVCQNGALMVSLDGWKNAKSAKFPHENMKKIDRNTERKSLNNLDKLEKTELDLFSLPDHMISYKHD